MEQPLRIRVVPNKEGLDPVLFNKLQLFFHCVKIGEASDRRSTYGADALYLLQRISACFENGRCRTEMFHQDFCMHITDLRNKGEGQLVEAFGSHVNSDVQMCECADDLKVIGDD